MRSEKNFQSKRGFSLLELLLVTALLPLLSFAIFANFSSGIRLWKTLNQGVPQEDVRIFYQKVSQDVTNTLKYLDVPFSGDKDHVSFATRVDSDPKLGGDRGIGRLGITSSGGKRGFIFVINPSLAQALDRAGYTRDKFKSAIAERAFKYSYDWQNDKDEGDAIPFSDPDTRVRSERAIFVAPVMPEEIHVVVGGGEAPQMGQCVAISSRSSAGRPMVTKKIDFPEKNGG